MSRKRLATGGGVHQAVILAGGLGTRLRPVLGDLPKALAPVHGRPFLSYQLEWLKSQSIVQVVLCTGHGHDRIQAYLGDGAACGLQVKYSVEMEPLGTAGALRQARSLLRGTFLAMNGDTYFATGLSGLYSAHRDSAALATMALVEVPNAGRFGAVTLDDEGYIIDFAEKARRGAGWINAGVYILESKVVDRFPARIPLSLETEVFPLLAQGRLLHGCVLSGYHIDIGTPESYAQFCRDAPNRIQHGEKDH